MLADNRIEFDVRYEVVRNGGTYRRISAYGYPSISGIASSELKMSFRGTFLRDNFDGINFLTDRLRVVVVLNGTEYPCGLFVITSVLNRKAGGVKVADLEGYSILYLAQRKKIETRLSLAAGANYITSINNLLIGAGITNFVYTASSLTLATVREDWEIGTPHLTIVNDLLSEINYNSAWVDLSGAVHLSKYAAPSLSNITQTYKAGALSLIGDDYTKGNDMHSKCNVFMAVCSNPDLSSPMTATSTNSDASSPFSTVNIGRVLSVTTVDNTPSQSELQATADRLKLQSLLSTETVEFATAINPTHTAFDVLALDNDELSGLFEETEWTISIEPGADMTHKAKRVTA
jgi:hypothetical protein